MGNVIEATILIGKFKGEHVLLPRIPMIPTDAPIQFKRLQFPIRLAFAMTINKAQGQSMQICGLDLENQCFSHGQLYVACSRVGKPTDLFVYTENSETKNIVHDLAVSTSIKYYFFYLQFNNNNNLSFIDIKIYNFFYFMQFTTFLTQ